MDMQYQAFLPQSAKYWEEPMHLGHLFKCGDSVSVLSLF